MLSLEERTHELNRWDAWLRARIAGLILGKSLWRAMFQSLPCPHGCGKNMGQHIYEKEHSAWRN